MAPPLQNPHFQPGAAADVVSGNRTVQIAVNPATTIFEEVVMASWKRNVKGILSQRVRLGFLSVPLWVAGAVFLARTLRNRRQQRLAA